MTDTLQVPKRRRLRFQNQRQIVDEVRALAARRTRQLGNWSLADICQHLATEMDLSIDGGIAFRVPLRTRVLARLGRNRILYRGIPSGFQLPAQAQAVLFREPENIDAAIVALERGITRLRATDRRAPHPVLGKLNVAQWDLFHLRHAELHLGFIVPDGDEGHRP